MAAEEAVEPVEQNTEGKIAVDPNKVITVLRQENEALRHELRLAHIALNDAGALAQQLRSEIDTIALQLAADKEGDKANTVKKTTNRNGNGAKK